MFIIVKVFNVDFGLFRFREFFYYIRVKFFDLGFKLIKYFKDDNVKYIFEILYWKFCFCVIDMKLNINYV